MPHIDLHNILTEEDALQKIGDIFEEVETKKEPYVITKGGRPVLAIIDVELFSKIDDNALNQTNDNTPTHTEPVAETPPTPIVQEESILIDLPPLSLDPEPGITPAFEPSPDLPDMPEEDVNSTSPLG